MGRGRGREDLRPFFALLGPEGCARLEAAAIDMNGAYAEELRAHCPHVAIVYDLFHVIAKYGREVVDRVRLDETLRLADRVRLRELLAANRALFTVYVRKDDLKQLWRYHYPAAARRFWAQWRARALASRLAPLRAFVQRLTPYLEGIINHCRYPLHTSVLEGINNKIKVIKRMAYGYRDDDYFWLPQDSRGLSRYSVMNP